MKPTEIRVNGSGLHKFMVSVEVGHEFDEKCGVCTANLDVVNQVIFDMLPEATIVFRDSDVPLDHIPPSKRLYINSFDRPVGRIVLDWIGETFADTLDFAHVSSIVFQDVATEKLFELKL